MITHIYFREDGTGKPEVFFGILSKGEKCPIYQEKVATAKNCVTWDGQVIVFEFDEVYVSALKPEAADTIDATVTGYAMEL